MKYTARNIISRVLALILLASVFSLVTVSSHEHIDQTEFFGSGDRKQGYDSEKYTTNSLSVTARQGVKADLLEYVNKPIPGLPKLKQPHDNLMTQEKIDLGRLLFFDRRLSLNDTFSCAI